MITSTGIFDEVDAQVAVSPVTPPAFLGILCGIALSAAIWGMVALTIF